MDNRGERPMRGRRRLRAVMLAGVVSLLLVTTGCGVVSGFHRDWRSAECCCPNGEAGLAGCWEGCWQSNSTGHQGRLKAIITHQAGDAYCARFHGTFFRVLPFEYSMRLNGYPEGDSYRLEGSKDLGRLAGGVYRFSGEADSESFLAHYNSSKDCGTFRMQRRPCGCCCQAAACDPSTHPSGP